MVCFLPATIFDFFEPGPASNPLFQIHRILLLNSASPCVASSSHKLPGPREKCSSSPAALPPASSFGLNARHRPPSKAVDLPEPHFLLPTIPPAPSRNLSLTSSYTPP